MKEIMIMFGGFCGLLVGVLDFIGALKSVSPEKTPLFIGINIVALIILSLIVSKAALGGRIK